MIRLLLKKQLTEIFRSYFYNPKKNKARTKAVTVIMFFFFILVMVGILGGMFGFLGWALCAPLHAAGVAWLHFIILGLLAIFFGTFGSVFNTFSGLYLGKDNDLLLSMPIPVRAILISRLLGVYLMGLMYSATVSLPAVIVYWIVAGPTFANVAGGLLWILLISVFVLILSCVLGWVVARISVKLKNRSIITALLAVIFLVLYYVVYFKAQSLIRKLIQNAVIYGEKIRGSARILYTFGKAGTGDWLSLLLMAAVILALLVLTWYVLNKSFLKIATATSTVAKVRYRERTARQSSADAALLRKEFARFIGSANYMLNTGLGILMLPTLGIALLVTRNSVVGPIRQMLGVGSTAVIFCAAMFSLCGMIEPATPSVSLEGKTLWQLQSLPVTGWQVLRAKLRTQLILALPVMLLCGICVVIVLSPELPLALLILGFSVIATLFMGTFCLFAGTLLPNLTWTNEIVPVKQSAAVLIAVLGGMALAGLMALLYFLIRPDPLLYLGLTTLVLALLAGLLYAWLRTRGVQKFESL